MKCVTEHQIKGCDSQEHTFVANHPIPGRSAANSTLLPQGVFLAAFHSPLLPAEHCGLWCFLASSLTWQAAPLSTRARCPELLRHSHHAGAPCAPNLRTFIARIRCAGAWVACVAALTFQPVVWRATQFTVPLSPLFPSLAVLSNILLISSLGTAAYARFGIWLVLSLVLYLSYGVHHTHDDGGDVELAHVAPRSRSGGLQKVPEEDASPAFSTGRSGGTTASPRSGALHAGGGLLEPAVLDEA